MGEVIFEGNHRKTWPLIQSATYFPCSQMEGMAIGWHVSCYLLTSVTFRLLGEWRKRPQNA